MIDVYQYIMAKQLEGYKITSGAGLSYHGLNDEEKIMKPQKRTRMILYGVTDADNNGK